MIHRDPFGASSVVTSNARPETFGGNIRLAKFLTLFILSAAFLLLALPSFAQGMLEPVGPVAEAQRAHLIGVVKITMIAILPVIVGVPILLIVYRRKGPGKYSPELEFSLPLELVFWGVPIAILFVLSYFVWKFNKDLDPYKPLGDNPLQVQVIGLDWKWVFIYPEQNTASVGTLVVPASQPVELNMTTDTVMQSLLMPQVAGQIYVMPGMVSKLNFMIDEPLTTHGMNSQYSGFGFTDQTFEVQSLSDDDWQSWVAQGGNALSLDATSYDILAKPGSTADALKELGSADGRMQLGEADIFETVVNRYRSGKAVLPSEQPGSPEYKNGAAQ